MLVIKRKDRESFTLTRGDETIKIVLLEGKRGSATIGIDAGKDWDIRRIDNVTPTETKEACHDGNGKNRDCAAGA